MNGAIELPRRHRQHRITAGEQPDRRPGDPIPVAQGSSNPGESIAKRSLRADGLICVNPPAAGVRVVTPISLTVNGQTVQALVEPRMHLGDFLREHCRLTGTHLGCEHGVCGACTVLIAGAPARSCIAYAVACDGCHPDDRRI